ncbi:MAG: hypothetical protein L6R28_25515 [Planctomycetes bacterium]|nr:hypothetical protein [Planctomycetota bacterium]
MKWTESQKVLRKIALSPVPQGLSSEIFLCEPFSGVSTAVRELARPTPLLDHGAKTPCVLKLNGTAPWEVVTTLSLVAGEKLLCSLAYCGNMERCMRKVAEKRGNSMTLMLQDAHLMIPRQLEKLLATLEWSAEHSGCNVRAVLLLGKVSRWNAKDQCREMAWPRIPERFYHEKQPRRWPVEKLHHFTRVGVDVLRQADAPEEMRNTQIMRSA